MMEEQFLGSRSPSQDGDNASVRELLSHGEVLDCQPLLWGSNYTFLVTISDHQEGFDKAHPKQCTAVYKPRHGEAPLRDFPSGTLCLREYAAYLVSEALGWGFIPPTVLREGPHGVGSVQLFVDAEPEANFFTFRYERIPELQRIAAFDHLTNNADRKGGHCLLGLDGKIWSIDHGLTFHSVPKLRTVIWDYAGQPIPEEVLSALQQFQRRLTREHPVVRELAELLEQHEMSALNSRLDALLRSGIYPLPGPGRNTPWPPI